MMLDQDTTTPLDRPLPPTLPLMIVPIAGTEGWGDTWWQDGSLWLTTLANSHVYPVRLDGRPFRWSTDLDGLGGFAAVGNMLRGLWRRPQHAVLHRDWEAGGDALGYFLRDLPYQSRNIIAHSHGGQVALYCAAAGMPIRTLTTVGTPVREDMFRVYQDARPHLGFHLHVCDARFDLWGTLGQLFDGQVSIQRTWPDPLVTLGTRATRTTPGPNLTQELAHIGHGDVLRKPAAIAYWRERGWLDLLRLGQAATRYKLTLSGGRVVV